MEQPVRISQFLNETGKIQKLPRKQAARYAVLVYLSEHFEKDRIYEEWEVNAVCGEWHTFGDYFLLRRELVESGLLCRKRDGSAYWKATTDTKPEPHP
jgi:hypothetical protein